MGILTSDASGKSGKLAKLLTTQHRRLSILSYLSAIVVAVYLVSEPDRTYFSDNALLPGLVEREFTWAQTAKETLTVLKEKAEESLDKIPYEWLTREFSKIGLEVHTHNFTLNYPFGAKPKFTGKNLYAILRSARSSSTESLVLSSPFRTRESAHGTTLPGIALMITIAKYFSSKTYWAKDIIFLISDHELVGVQAWLDAFHDIQKPDAPVLDHGFLAARSGPIQAAVNLEIHSEQSSRIDIKIEGLNGQLPNLDLFNVAVELCTRESITPTLHSQSHPIDGDRWEALEQSAITISSMMVSQGITLPTGAHGLFQRFSIQAITLEAPEIANPNDPSYIPISFKHFGRLIEGIFRSLNNLLEKFNRSYYFYLLTSTRRYISIGYYMIPFGLLTAPLIFNALNLYLKIGVDSPENGTRFLNTSLWTSLPFCFACHLLGLLLLLVPYSVEKLSHLIANYPTQDAIYYTLITLSILYVSNPLMKIQTENLLSRKCVALLNLALLLGSLSLVNISLAFALSFIYVPIACITRNSSVNIYKLVNRIFIISIHPLAIGYFSLFIMSVWYDSTTSLLSHSIRAFGAQKKVILFYIEDWYIYGNWTYFFGCSVLLPAWLQLWFSL